MCRSSSGIRGVVYSGSIRSCNLEYRGVVGFDTLVCEEERGACVRITLGGGVLSTVVGVSIVDVRISTNYRSAHMYSWIMGANRDDGCGFLRVNVRSLDESTVTLVVDIEGVSYRWGKFYFACDLFGVCFGDIYHVVPVVLWRTPYILTINFMGTHVFLLDGVLCTNIFIPGGINGVLL